MEFILNISQIIIAFLLTGSILLQNQGSGLGMAFGGEGNVYRTKRGVEKHIYRLTIVLSFLFLGAALVNFFI